MAEFKCKSTAELRMCAVPNLNYFLIDSLLISTGGGL